MGRLTLGEYFVDTDEKKLLRGQQPLELSSMSVAVLCYFVEHAADGRVVTKSELRSQVWGCKVEDGTIRSHVSFIREALGDEAASPRYLQTHGKEGWRLLMPVTQPPKVPRSGLPAAPGARCDPDGYVSRPAEERMLLSCLQTPGRPAVVFGPPGSGKRSLIERVLDQAVAHRPGSPLARVLRISGRELSEAPVASLDALLKEAGRLLLEATDKTPEDTHKIVEALWSQPILAKQKLRELVLTHAIQPTQPTALVIHDVDRLAAYPFQDDFFNMLRAWQEDRLLGSLRCVLETLLPPRLFPFGGAQSPLWTKVQRIDVSFIDLQQLTQLALLHGLAPSPISCERLGALVGWNLYLCRTALFHAAVQSQTLEAVLAEYQPAKKRFGGFADHLEDLGQALERLEAMGSFPKPLGTLLRDAGQGVALSPEVAWRLVQKGVVVEAETRGRYRIRCPLYADALRGPQP